MCTVVLGALSLPLALNAQAPDSAVAKPVNLAGYVTTSYTYGTQAVGRDIVGRLYGRRHNEFMLNVANITLERVAATGKVDAGFRVETFLGQNAAVVKSNGLDLGTNADIWQAYVVLNLPLNGASQYLQFKAGKMATLMGVEVGEDVLNPNLDVATQDILLEPFTETGVEAYAKLGSHVDANLRVSNGWDQVTDINTGKTFMGRIGLTPDGRTLLALVGYVGPEQAGTNGPKRAGANLVAMRTFGTGTTAWLQLDYGQEDSLGPAGDKAKWYAAGLWLTQDAGRYATVALRGDYIDDRDGARTSGVLGYPVHNGQKLGGATATLNLKRWDKVLVRPEIRYDRSTLLVFDGKKDQVAFGLGLSYLF